MGLFLAIDAGGTKTTCLLADDTRVLAHAATGTVKLVRVSEEEATARMQEMLDDVAADAGVALDRVTRTCLGLAGLSSSAVRTWAHSVVAPMVAGEFLLCGDEEIALDAAFQGGTGILVIAGTGSNVVGRCATGSLFNAGGWGSVLGDEGSGYWIGLEAVRAGLHAHDRIGAGGSPSTLLPAIQAEWEVDSIAELVALGNQRSGLRRPAPDFATLAPVVARCADAGDALAAEVLVRAGEELAGQIAVVSRKMSAACATTSHSVGVAYTGSVLSHIVRVREAMIERLVTLVPEATVLDAPVDSLEGALWRARRGRVASIMPAPTR